METNRSRVISAVFLSLVVGTLFLRLDNHQNDARSKLGLIYTVMCYFSFTSLNALPDIIAERAVYYYQRDTRYYTPLPYLLANNIAEVCESTSWLLLPLSHTFFHFRPRYR